MRIEKYAFFFLFLFVFLEVKATAQSGDVVYIGGEEWRLMAKPINNDSALYARLRNFLPGNHCASTANGDGYTAFWEIRDDCLYLKRMEICVYNEASREESNLIFDADTLKTLFAPYYERGEICARWFSGELRAGKGNLVRYVHAGFYSSVETERVMTIRQGRVVECTIYHNYRKTRMADGRCAGRNNRALSMEAISRIPRATACFLCP